ncbi:MAG: His-Xaa-Ser system radical SAM maturase HxsC [Caulobacter sp.]|nr:His-Xaa-Ser system radical SAM maturase HxsC [Caulobacter sp.]
MTLGLAKHTHAHVEGVEGVRLLKVLTAEEADGSALPSSSILLWNERAQFGSCGYVQVAEPRDHEVIRPGDIVRLREGGSLVSILYRRGSAANVLFATERCNSLCLMCSQPPRDEDDAWRIEELLQMVPLVDRTDSQLGITGGEPTLLGEGLVRILDACARELPDTELHVLTNGRRFADPEFARDLARAGGRRTIWAVPLAGDGPARHDEIMGSPGGFNETMLGLAELAAHGARVEIRVVLHAMSIPRLPQLAEFIYRRLPFVEHVALMGLEPMGYAKGNRERLWIDPADYIDPLFRATRHLADRGMQVSIYNLPLCVLPESLRAFARQSISDWKNRFPDECAPCAVKDECAGFFASAGPAWRSRAVAPIMKEESAHELA